MQVSSLVADPQRGTGDGYRFYNMRRSGEPGKENTSQLVSTTPSHLGKHHLTRT